MQSEYEKMIAGEIYRPQDEDLRKIRARSKEFQYRFNQEQDSDKRSAIIKEWFGCTGENLAMKPDLVCDYGINIHLGENFCSNWNLTMLDVCPIRIGDNAMLGPNCIHLIQWKEIPELSTEHQSLLVITSGLAEV